MKVIRAIVYECKKGDTQGEQFLLTTLQRSLQNPVINKSATITPTTISVKDAICAICGEYSDDYVCKNCKRDTLTKLEG